MGLRLGGVDTATGRQTQARPRLTRQDRLVYSGIIGSALVCLALLAWGHLGMGALLFPPKNTTTQVAAAGTITVTLKIGAPGLTAKGPNTLTFTMQDAHGRPLDGASVRVEPKMVAMEMSQPARMATENGSGVYLAHPTFGMAGDWRLAVTITQRGAAPQSASFIVGVRWK